MKCNIDNCSIYKTQKILKHKWIPIIIYCINLEVNSFNQLVNTIEHISNNQLSRSLSMLLKSGIILNEDSNYRLTEKGEKLNEIIMMMMEFDRVNNEIIL